jgi:hypothetical protein
MPKLGDDADNESGDHKLSCALMLQMTTKQFIKISNRFIARFFNI